MLSLQTIVPSPRTPTQCTRQSTNKGSITYDVSQIVLGHEPRVIAELAQLVFGPEQILREATDDGHEMRARLAVGLRKGAESNRSPEESGRSPTYRLHDRTEISMPLTHTLFIFWDNNNN